jgi:hypothetical protein
MTDKGPIADGLKLGRRNARVDVQGSLVAIRIPPKPDARDYKADDRFEGETRTIIDTQTTVRQRKGGGDLGHPAFSTRKDR